MAASLVSTQSLSHAPFAPALHSTIAAITLRMDAETVEKVNGVAVFGFSRLPKPFDGIGVLLVQGLSCICIIRDKTWSSARKVGAFVSMFSNLVPGVPATILLNSSIGHLLETPCGNRPSWLQWLPHVPRFSLYSPLCLPDDLKDGLDTVREVRTRLGISRPRSLLIPEHILRALAQSFPRHGEISAPADEIPDTLQDAELSLWRCGDTGRIVRYPSIIEVPPTAEESRRIFVLCEQKTVRAWERTNNVLTLSTTVDGLPVTVKRSFRQVRVRRYLHEGLERYIGNRLKSIESLVAPCRAASAQPVPAKASNGAHPPATAGNALRKYADHLENVKGKIAEKRAALASVRESAPSRKERMLAGASSLAHGAASIAVSAAAVTTRAAAVAIDTASAAVAAARAVAAATLALLQSFWSWLW